MKKANGLRGYFYEYVYYRAIDQARDQTGQIIPISQGKAIRAQVDTILGQRGTALADPELGVQSCLRAIDTALGEQLTGYEAQFGDYSTSGERYKELHQEFTQITGIGAERKPQSAHLPISPYDPQWAERASVKKGGTELSYLADASITKATGGDVGRLSDPRFGNLKLWRADNDGKLREVGYAMTDEDASGLTTRSATGSSTVAATRRPAVWIATGSCLPGPWPARRPCWMNSRPRVWPTRSCATVNPARSRLESAAPAWRSA